jgi:hypothetical protein
VHTPVCKSRTPSHPFFVFNANLAQHRVIVFKALSTMHKSYILSQHTRKDTGSKPLLVWSLDSHDLMHHFAPLRVYVFACLRVCVSRTRMRAWLTQHNQGSVPPLAALCVEADDSKTLQAAAAGGWAGDESIHSCCCGLNVLI